MKKTAQTPMLTGTNRFPMQGYSFEKLSPENIGSLRPLYQTVFRKKISLTKLRKKYDTDRFGAGLTGYIAIFENREAVAFYGVIPSLVKINGQPVLAAQSADTMTHPVHRNYGLFVTLAEKTYDLAKRSNIQFVFGFPNQNSLPGFKKLNWHFAKPAMWTFIFRGSIVPFSKIVTIPFLKKPYFAKPLHVDNSNVFPDEENAVLHDTNFVRYKSFSESFVVKAGKSLIVAKNDGDLKIGCVHLHPEESFTSLLTELKRIAIICGCYKIVFMTSENTTLFRFLSAHAEGSRAFHIGFLNLSERPITFDDIQFEYCDFDTF